MSNHLVLKMPTLRRHSLGAIVVYTAALAIVGCSDTVTPTTSPARLRIVNSLYVGLPASAAPATIDVLVDSSSSASGSVAGLAANSVTTGTAGFGGQTANAGYTALPAGIHSFVVKIPGRDSTLYTAATNRTYLPRQQLNPFPYTLVVAGVAPATGIPAPAAVPFVTIVDDPFTPPADTTSTGLTARIQLINAAPFADPTGAGLGTRVAYTLSGPRTFTGGANYRASSGYVNPPSGTYTLTLTVTSGSGATAITRTIFTGPLVLAKGEVRTLIVQNTGPAPVPSASNHKLTNLLDNTWP